jgi:hypothetical protein
MNVFVGSVEQADGGAIDVISIFLENENVKSCCSYHDQLITAEI